MRAEDRSAGSREALAKFLAVQLEIDEADLPGASAWSECGQTIGAFALRLGILSLDQIDAIIDFQSQDKKLFGEIAIHLGFLTPEQVERLLDLQEFHRALELGELLVLLGRLDVKRMSELMAAFLQTPR